MAVYAICTGSTRNEAFVPVIFRIEDFCRKIHCHKILICLNFMVGAAGIELATPPV
jgi:hypothetical protein